MTNINRGRYTVQLSRAPVQLGEYTRIGAITRGAIVCELVADSTGVYFALPGLAPLIQRKVIAAINAQTLDYPLPDVGQAA